MTALHTPTTHQNHISLKDAGALFSANCENEAPSISELISSPLHIDAKEANRFLEALDPGAERWTFQTINDKGGRSGLAQIFHSSLDDALSQLNFLQDGGAGVFVTVNETDLNGRTAGNITRIRAIFADCDGTDPQQMLDSLQPHIVIESSPGKFHLYWVVSDCLLDQFKPVQQAIAKVYGTDGKVCDLPRVLRLPGSWHQKSEPFQSRVIEINDLEPYLLKEIIDRLKLASSIEKMSTVTRSVRPTQAMNGFELLKITSALGSIDPDFDYDSWLHVGMALHHATGGGSQGLDAWDRWSERGPLYNDGECKFKWSTFDIDGNASSQITVGTIFHMALKNDWTPPISPLLFKNPKGKLELLPDSTMAAVMAKNIPDLMFDVISSSWYSYSGCVWLKVCQTKAKYQIRLAMDKGCDPLGYPHAKLSSMDSFLRLDLSRDLKASDPDLLPFSNGVLKVSTKEFIDHSAEHYLTWHLPYEYSSNADAKPVIDWLTKTLSDDLHQTQIIRAFGRAILTGAMSHMQKYLELIGAAGSGKSSIIRMLAVVMGRENYYTTTLKELELNRFETANLYGKRLVAITDAESFIGDVTTLKAATGGDDLRYEVKNVQAAQPYTFTGGLILAGNKDIKSNDHSNGLQRRRITLRLNNVIAPEEMKDLDPIFHQCAAGLVNWMMDMSEEDMTAYLKTPGLLCGAIVEARHEQMLNTNQLYRWFDECVDLAPGFKTYIGKALKGINVINAGTFREPREKLYPNYEEWVQSQGNERATSLQNFSNDLICLLVEQLRLPGIKKGKDAHGVFIEGIKIRIIDVRPFTSGGGSSANSNASLPPVVVAGINNLSCKQSSGDAAEIVMTTQ